MDNSPARLIKPESQKVPVSQLPASIRERLARFETPELMATERSEMLTTSARLRLDVLLRIQAVRESEIQRTQKLAAAVRAHGSSADPLMGDIEHHRKELGTLRFQIEAAQREYTAAMDQLRQEQDVARGRRSISA